MRSGGDEVNVNNKILSQRSKKFCLLLILHYLFRDIDVRQEQRAAAHVFEAELIENNLWILACFNTLLELFPKMPNRLPTRHASNWYYH